MTMVKKNPSHLHQALSALAAAFRSFLKADPAGGTKRAASVTSGDITADLRPVSIIGIAIIGSFFGLFGVWAAVAPIASAAIANGVISPEGSRKVVQHLEGGIIDRILVRDGEAVKAGDPLLVLKTTQARANYELVLGQKRALVAMQARLVAEQLHKAEITFPDWLIADVDEPTTAELLEVEQNLFATRRDAYQGRIEILQQRAGQLREQIAGIRSQVQSEEEQLRLIDEEIAGVSELVRKGLGKKPRLLELQRRRAEISGRRGANLAAIAEAQQRIGETDLQIVNEEKTRLDEIAEKLTKVRAELASIDEKLHATDDILERTVITAPVSGTILDMRYRTPGGVIAPGAAIMQIVPTEEELVIEARVRPVDIDAVREGLDAQIHLLAYSQRTLPLITGKVRSVSADALTDEVTGETFFRAQVNVDGAELSRLTENVEILPGMPAEVMIMTGERTLAGYLAEPFVKSFRRAFRET